MSTTYRKIINNVDQALHQPGMISDLALKLEKCTGVRRIYMAQGWMSDLFYFLFIKNTKTFSILQVCLHCLHCT